MRTKQSDAVDHITSQWNAVRPDIDTSPIEVIGRVSRLSRLIDRRLAENFARSDLESWMYDVLATLRRSGEPYELTAGDLMRQAMVTTGALTNRIDRLEQRGLV
ncbi:MAG: MarR family transcriptional regulator, partial [Actinomycetota bacterium]|nr:MarR family transcriptional regulator [Actinomycetota bacterium]